MEVLHYICTGCDEFALDEARWPSDSLEEMSLHALIQFGEHRRKSKKCQTAIMKAKMDHDPEILLLHLTNLLESANNLREDMHTNHHHKKGSQLMTIASGSSAWYRFNDACIEARQLLAGDFSHMRKFMTFDKAVIQQREIHARCDAGEDIPNWREVSMKSGFQLITVREHEGSKTYSTGPLGVCFCKMEWSEDGEVLLCTKCFMDGT